MARIALGLEYDGTDFVGWQSQRAGRSVQGALAGAVSSVANEPITVNASGRTDAGVHAAQQVAHFDTTAERKCHQWVLGINSNLPPDVAVLWAKKVPAGFDARRTALSRHYRYVLLQRSIRPAIVRWRTWWSRELLDCSAMTIAATAWLGENDFTAFRASGCQSSTPIRRLQAVGIYHCGSQVVLEFKANAFLQHMVRNLVGVLVKIGQGRAEPSWATEVLTSRDRTEGGVTAPAQGLTLVGVTYPDHYEIPVVPEGDWRLPL
ncbi:MAG: tRNA pseudouridine(38-40) synthase TruA [Gammaproteobacteria bacterium]